MTKNEINELKTKLYLALLKDDDLNAEDTNIMFALGSCRHIQQILEKSLSKT